MERKEKKERNAVCNARAPLLGMVVFFSFFFFSFFLFFLFFFSTHWSVGRGENGTSEEIVCGYISPCLLCYGGV